VISDEAKCIVRWWEEPTVDWDRMFKALFCTSQKWFTHCYGPVWDKLLMLLLSVDVKEIVSFSVVSNVSYMFEDNMLHYFILW